MDLDWSKQVQVLNKEVMDWRWKAFAAEVDPAQLRSSVVEYLLPRMEIGLVHANVTKKMCDAWTSTIITTICHRGGMSTVATLNKKAFLVLAEIPDIWMRTQTTRACELLVSLNTNYCEVGRSTIARLCDLAKVPPRDSRLAVEELTSLRSLSMRKFCRLASTIQYLKKLKIEVAIKTVGDQSPLLLSIDLHNTMRDIAQGSQIIAYTDGSTDQKHPSGNSGLGIVITDCENQTLWTGGLVVRADGNNFIPELAAAAIVIKAVPLTLRLTLRTDSLATIGAISKGPISERKRILAAGRPWLNLCRDDLLRKRARISVEHVFSHRGNLSPEQQGNELADAIANHYRRTGETCPAETTSRNSKKRLCFSTIPRIFKGTLAHF
jgi:ribonuclease HI